MDEFNDSRTTAGKAFGKIAFTCWAHASRMVAPPVDSLRTLEASASRAGIALACCYSSADEFEAELIRERRAAGAYGNPHVAQLRLALAATVAASRAALHRLIG